MFVFRCWNDRWYKICYYVNFMFCNKIFLIKYMLFKILILMGNVKSFFKVFDNLVFEIF